MPNRDVDTGRLSAPTIARRLYARLRRPRPNGPTPHAPQKPTYETPDGVKLNLGCGFDHREGWLNVDLHDWHKPDMVADVCNLTDIEDNHADYALAQDILEHIHRDRCETALREWNRILKMGGHVELRVPDVAAIVDLMRAPDRQSEEEHERLLQCMFGTQSYEGDFHLNGFTDIYLRSVLGRSGFELVYLGHKDGWLFEAVAKKVEHTPPAAMLRAETDEDFLTQAYRHYLNRDPDPGGRDAFLAKLQDGTPREVIAAILKHADE